MEGIMKTLIKQSCAALAIAAACIATPASAKIIYSVDDGGVGISDNGGSSFDGGFDSGSGGSYFAGGDPSNGVTVIGNRCSAGWTCYSWVIPGTVLPVWGMVPSDGRGGDAAPPPAPPPPAPPPTDPNCITKCSTDHTIRTNQCNIDGDKLRQSLSSPSPIAILLGGFFRWGKQGTPFADIETPSYGGRVALSPAEIDRRVANYKSFCTSVADTAQNVCLEQVCHAMIGLLGLLIPASWLRRRRDEDEPAIA
jgi:hypothetical protein